MEERTFGAVLISLSLILPVAYAYLLFFSPWYLETIKLTVEAAVLALSLIALWIGRSMIRVAPVREIRGRGEQK